jgi:hypothetical protein
MRLFEVTLFDRDGKQVSRIPYSAMRTGDIFAFARQLMRQTKGAVCFRFEEA